LAKVILKNKLPRFFLVHGVEAICIRYDSVRVHRLPETCMCISITQLFILQLLLMCRFFY